ncbi:13986_t:CDS:2, partial [Dentiscutata erythropus]
YQNLSEDIITLLDNNSWWQTIEELGLHLLPFTAILNCLQQDTAQLSNSDKVFLLAQIYAEITYNCKVEAAQSLEQQMIANIDQQVNFLKLEQNFSTLEQNFFKLKQDFEFLKSDEIINNNDLKSNKEVNKMNSGSEDLSLNTNTNKLLLGLKHPADDLVEK